VVQILLELHLILVHQSPHLAAVVAAVAVTNLVLLVDLVAVVEVVVLLEMLHLVLVIHPQEHLESHHLTDGVMMVVTEMVLAAVAVVLVALDLQEMIQHHQKEVLVV
jgi:hypothetical protein